MSVCLVCGSDRIETVYEPTFAGGLDEAHNYFLTARKKAVHGRIVECQACRFRFTSPQYTPDEYHSIYAKTSPPAEDDGSSSRFEFLARRVREAAPPGRFLDFGCGGGGFLAALSDREGIGLEVGLGDGSWRGPIYRGRLETAARNEPAFAPSSFDFIVSWDVFEHLPEIARDLENLHRLLRNDGLLFFTVPNVASLSAKLWGRRWSNYLLEHLWYFTPDTIDRFLSDRGFRKATLHGFPYRSNFGTLVARLNQTFNMRLPSPEALKRIVLPMPVGLMYGAYRKA